MTMTNENQIVTINKAYKITSVDEEAFATALYIYPDEPNRAIFFAPEMNPTPFVSWEYVIYPKYDTISLCRGRYYKTMAAAMAAEAPDILPQSTDKRTNYLVLDFYCPDCDEHMPAKFDLSTPANHLLESLSDHAICDSCGRPCLETTSCAITDTRYTVDIPLYKGPTT